VFEHPRLAQGGPEMTQVRHFTSRTIPEQYRDTSSWPQINLADFPAADRLFLEKNQCAVREYLNGLPLAQVCEEFNLNAAELVRRLNRALDLHPDGSIYGWRALLPWIRIKPYERTAPLREDSRGLAGAWRTFLKMHPAVTTGLNKVILDGKIDGIHTARLTTRDVHYELRELCRKHEVPLTQYPFNTTDAGRRSLSRYIKELYERHVARGARRQGGPDAATRARTGTGFDRSFIARHPYEIVSTDAHRLNFHGTVRITVNGEDRFFPIHRLLFIPILEHDSRCVLDYHVAVGKEASASDVLRAVRNALDVWKPRPLPPGLTYPTNAALPSGVIPESRGQCWSLFFIDNASIHYSKIVADRIPQSIGCTVCWGAFGDWFQRPEIESLFSSLERRGFLSLPNSTGTGPQDPRRNDSVKNAVDLEITWEELLDLIDVSVCTYNGTARSEFGNRSPLQRLSDAFSRASTDWLPRIQPVRPPSAPDLDVTLVELTVRGNIAEGRRPYIQYQNVRYTSPVLANLPQLIGKTIVAHIQDDLRQFRVFLKGGAELGFLRAMGGWAISRHDHALRKAIFTAIRKDHLVVSPDENPVMEYIHFKARKAVRGKKEGKRPTILPEVTQLVRAIQVSNESVPEVNDAWRPAKGEPVHEPPMAPNPSYVPSIKHKGLIT
jgi:putative transposase